VSASSVITISPITRLAARMARAMKSFAHWTAACKS
jgi:hypothetical protein